MPSATFKATCRSMSCNVETHRSEFMEGTLSRLF